MLSIVFLLFDLDSVLKFLHKSLVKLQSHPLVRVFCQATHHILTICVCAVKSYEKLKFKENLLKAMFQFILLSRFYSLIIRLNVLLLHLITSTQIYIITIYMYVLIRSFILTLKGEASVDKAKQVHTQTPDGSRSVTYPCGRPESWSE